jgi:glycosyltransferase involved in cell wall biosynthesis
MAAGRPVVASAVGGLADIVLDDTTGILVPAGDATALRAGIHQLLADPARRLRMGEAGRERAASYAAGVVVPQIERVYREAIAERPQPVVATRRR